MADHKVEQILDAIIPLVTGLTTTGANVKRGRVSPHQDSLTAALAVYQGPDNTTEFNWPSVYSDLSVYIDIHAKDSSEQIDQVLNRIRKEINVAVMAVDRLGLSFVKDVNEEGASEPELSGDGNKPTAVMRVTYKIEYNRSVTDPSL